ncbi:MAG: NAD(+)/NADH kinase [Candidatus Ratteibacteria bacterium]|nr:NAD(+)/NADH kinase [Candidatus Ratteibacteria bacterium]
MIKNVFILHNKKIPGIEKERDRIEKLLKKCGKVVKNSPEGVDLIITMGGDGTFLKGAHQIDNPRTLIYGIKYGKVGFLTHTAQDIDTQLKKVLSGSFKIYRRMLLEATVNKKNGKTIKDFCLNEVSIFRKGIRIIDIVVSTRKEEVFGNLRCDGFIVSTPTGSTAHSLSASGPVVFPDMECILLVPVAPHSISWRPVIVPSNEILSLSVSPEGVVIIDGQREIDVGYSDRVVIKKAKKGVKIIDDDNSFFSKLKTKFHWGI